MAGGRKPKIGTIHEAMERNDPDECWPWPHLIDRGYGLLSIDGKKCRAHRASYEHYVGPIPEGMFIDHICGNTPCFNPAHLRAVTPKGNTEHFTRLSSNNTSGHRGVHFNKKMGKYQAYVQHSRKRIHCGYHDTAEEAGAAALAKRTELGFLTGFNDIINKDGQS